MKTNSCSFFAKTKALKGIQAQKINVLLGDDISEQ